MNKDFVYMGYTEHFNDKTKIGKTSCLGSRVSQMNTSYSSHSFSFRQVINIIKDSAIDGATLEYILHQEYIEYKIKGNAGLEWFELNDNILNVDIKELLEHLEENGGLKYQLLSREQIDIELDIYNRSIQSIAPSNINLCDFMWNKSIKLYDYQNECFNKAIEKYLTNDKLVLNWTCGLGKTIMSLKISSYYVSNRLLIAVPSTLLLKQWLTNIYGIGCYNRYKLLVICSDKDSVLNSLHNRTLDSYCITTNPEKITDFIGKNRKCVVITMYQSSHILKTLYMEGKLKTPFEFSILDECHHLCKWLDNKSKHQNTDVLDIPNKKRLGLTATMKKLTNENSIDNYDEKIFGIKLDEKSVSWAIENKKITDYYILTLNMKQETLETVMEDCKIEKGYEELFLSAYMTLMALCQYSERKANFTHTLIYTNTTEKAELVTKYIKIILDRNIIKINNDDIYYRSLHSNSKDKDDINNDTYSKTILDNELNQFKKAKYGIISCVYIFGEGFDLPKLNGVVFGENMQSEIRIVQSALRGNRIDKTNIDKISYIIIPFIDCDSATNVTFEKVIKILGRMRKEDKTIDQKIRASKMNDKPSPKVPICPKKITVINELIHDEKLTSKIKLLLRPSETLNQCVNNINIPCLRYSKILKCCVIKANDIITNNKKYKSILIDILKSIPRNKILSTCKFKFKSTNEKGLYGYQWSQGLNMSIQSKDSLSTMKEIINMVKLYKYTMNITIKLKNTNIINYNL